MSSKAVLVLMLMAAAAMLCAGSSGATSSKHTALPWYMTGHLTVTTHQGGWKTMPPVLRRKFTGRALATAVDCRKWVSKTFTYWNLWKKIGIRVVLWTLTEKVGYCTDGTNVTYFYRVRSWTRPPLPVIKHIFRYNPWSFDGYQQIDYDCSDEHCWEPGKPQPSRMAIVEAQFSAHPCIANLCNIVYPIVLIVVYGNGQVVTRTGQG